MRNFMEFKDSYSGLNRHYAFNRLENLSHNPLVLGSNPDGPTIFLMKS
jgi:hypothetical protein